MSAATRLQAMRPTDIGVPGPSSLDMARAFRSIRADPLSFLVQVSERFGDLVAFPVPGAPMSVGRIACSRVEALMRPPHGCAGRATSRPRTT